MQTKQIPNFLFIMCDQLRWDYLGYAGHPSLETPTIDALARRSVNFTNCYTQSPVCGPSRMSTYTGRTAFSHGSTWNGVPLSISELTMADYFRDTHRVAVVGKTHIVDDRKGMDRLGITQHIADARQIRLGGFEPFDKDDGIHTEQLMPHNGEPRYNEWLRTRGYPGSNPWHDFANSVETPDGRIISGWEMRSAPYPTRVLPEHSETAYMAGRAIQFIQESHERPWLLHLSFIKPHWPYVAPAPYHAMYGPSDVLPAMRSVAELEAAHPVYKAFTNRTVSKSFARDEVRQAVIPAYMGMVRQLDDEIGRVLDALASSGQAENTVVVFTSDHGDYLGDHWLGEKELFHDASARVPLLVMDPRAPAQGTRGTTITAPVECIDILPTLLDLAALPVDDRIEGRSLAPQIEGKEGLPREAVFSEIDYSYYSVRRDLGAPIDRARAYMLRTKRWKYVHYLGLGEQLFDLQEDPGELRDLGKDGGHTGTRQSLGAMLLDRLATRRMRTTQSDAIVERRCDSEEAIGIFIGRW